MQLLSGGVLLHIGVANLIIFAVAEPEGPVARSGIHVHCCIFDGAPSSSEVTRETGVSGSSSICQGLLCGGTGKVSENKVRKSVSSTDGVPLKGPE